LRNSFRLMGCAIVLGGFIAGVAPSCAAQVYSYTIEHPTYGEIGTYTDTIEKSGDTMRIDTRLRVAVKVLGIVVHREEADRTELWHADRLVSFHSVTTTNGKPIEVRGEAHDNGFVITSPTGTVVAPPNVYTSSPWSTRRPNTGLMMSTKTGRVETVETLGGEETLVPFYGGEGSARHYQFITDKHQDVWLDGSGIPVRFRTEVAGKPIDFILAHGAVAALGPQ
jgi:Family of unknown function (DUF6134)